MAVRIQFRRGTAAEWTSANPTLAAGELGYETDTAKTKVGDGTTVWSSLAYAGVNQDDINAAVANVIDFAPGTLDTLNELAASIGDDGDFANTVADNLSAAVDAHNSGTTSVHGIADTSVLETQSGAQAKADAALASAESYTNAAITNVIDSAPGALDTLNELAAALGDDPNFATTVTNGLASKINFVIDSQTNFATANAVTAANTIYVITGVDGTYTKIGDGATAYNDLDVIGKGYADSAIGVHNAVTTNVHGIADTSDLLVTLDLTNHSDETLSVHGIANTADLVLTADLTAHTDATLNVHGIANTADLVVTSQLTTHTDETLSVHGIANTADLVLTADLGGASSTELGYVVGASSSIQDQISNIESTFAPLASPTLTGNVSLPASTTIGDISAAELGYLTTVSANVQDQLDAKLASATASSTYAPINSPTFTGTVVLPVDTSIDGVSAAEIGYLANVTSDVQAQIDAKAPIASPTFTGTVAGITKAMVGLGNVNNTADANKPISTSTQTALDGKAALAGATFTGEVVLNADPTQALGAVTKQYADSISEGLHVHEAVEALSDSNIDLTGGTFGGTIDGVTLADTDRVIVNGQTSAADNGIYVFNATGSTFTRATDFDEPAEAAGGDFVFVLGGTTYQNTGWVKTTGDVSVIGTDPIVFTQFSGAGSVTAGTNVEVTGTQVSLVADPTLSDATITNLDITNLVFPDGTQTGAGVASITGFTEKTASYQLDTLSHKDNVVEMNSGSAVTFTIPLEATTSWPVGASMDIIQTGAGQVTIDIEAGGTLNYTPGNKLRTQWSSCTIMKRGADSWILYGDLTA